MIGVRLPALTPKQMRLEAARQFHERIWLAYLWGQSVQIDGTGRRYAIQARFHRFWNSRGYRLKLRGNTVRLEAMSA